MYRNETKREISLRNENVNPNRVKIKKEANLGFHKNVLTEKQKKTNRFNRNIEKIPIKKEKFTKKKSDQRSQRVFRKKKIVYERPNFLNKPKKEQNTELKNDLLKILNDIQGAKKNNIHHFDPRIDHFNKVPQLQTDSSEVETISLKNQLQKNHLYKEKEKANLQEKGNKKEQEEEKEKKKKNELEQEKEKENEKEKEKYRGKKHEKKRVEMSQKEPNNNQIFKKKRRRKSNVKNSTLQKKKKRKNKKKKEEGEEGVEHMYQLMLQEEDQKLQSLIQKYLQPKINKPKKLKKPKKQKLLKTGQFSQKPHKNLPMTKDSSINGSFYYPKNLTQSDYWLEESDESLQNPDHHNGNLVKDISFFSKYASKPNNSWKKNIFPPSPPHNSHSYQGSFRINEDFLNSYSKKKPKKSKKIKNKNTKFNHELQQKKKDFQNYLFATRKRSNRKRFASATSKSCNLSDLTRIETLSKPPIIFKRKKNLKNLTTEKQRANRSKSGKFKKSKTHQRLLKILKGVH
ncbi:hypothetical protein M0812_02465 [Anaeramoeba flamelloides]|uniref:Uncharacterized protein n=1 Tax=Anaeramoeba flamelloides TaxID=1746091 RepID=A0AAV7YLY6_9EUKA|nr:hypothetical protein M0812_02465 [Anaeramoeba flamelloides]